MPAKTAGETRPSMREASESRHTSSRPKAPRSANPSNVSGMRATSPRNATADEYVRSLCLAAASSTSRPSAAAVSVQVAEERVLPAGEREERHRRGDADVDADHPRLRLVAELAHRCPARGE